ncbi:hypothetical protein LOTGIDRAFT_139814 [Lottia gigantea]|uniref:Hexosyltransferase n=1 Tax=Lottia gigantea TaxID=225164 RepID=V4B1K6_LOTGI|nr:hypothetical protein LOTGIDRAFT_139814 [Lottia gigantea]ESP01191.1 hypothetical protein LOTGIDRAFT_139814 [Lottia gigantea]
MLMAVMTSRKFLETRALDIHETWGSRVPGSILYFVGDAETYAGDLPVVTLNNINDTSYPPQRKSFTMIEFISKTLTDHYEWFVRSDDDIYIRTDKLELLLRRLDSSKAWYIGQPGYGLKHERGKLGLVKPFCMGGVGITFSRSVLVEVGKHLVSDCLNNTVTTHEDTELGRCIYKFTGLPCTTSSKVGELKILFNSAIRRTNGRCDWLEVGAITLHPIKVHPHMLRIDSLYSDLKVQQLVQKMNSLQQEIFDSDETLKTKMGTLMTTAGDVEILDDDVVLGSDIAFKFENAPESRAKIEDLPRLIEKEIEYEWDSLDWRNRRLNTQGSEYHKTKMYFTSSIFIPKIATELEIKYGSKLEFKKLLPFIYLRLKSGTDIEFILQHKDNNNKKHLIKTIQKFSGIQFREMMPLPHPETWIILPLLGRSIEYRRFLDTLVRAVEKNGKLIKLKVVLYEDGGGQFRLTQKISNHFRNSSKNLSILTILTKGPFSRGRAISKGVEQLSLNSLLIFMDVDMYIDEYFLHRAVLNTIRGKQVWFPICFSQFNPIIACYRKHHCSMENNHGDDFGLWREFGFGIASMYRQDLIKVGGFNLKIQGWGREDQELYEKIIQRSDLHVLRTVDPSLIHIYHEKSCNREELGDKFTDCLGSKLSLYGNMDTLATIVMDLRVIKV